MSENRPTITASTAEGFAELEKMVNDLPKRIIGQLENVNNCFGILVVGIFREKYETNPTILIPNDTREIKHKDDEVIVYTPKWIFKHPLKCGDNRHAAERVNFILIDPNEDKK